MIGGMQTSSRRAAAFAITALLVLVAAPVLAAPELVEVPLTDGPVTGTFVTPAGARNFPAIVLLGGSEGGAPVADARRFAEHGYAALALGYFGLGALPKQLRAIPLETVTRGIDWLAARPEVDASRIGIEGGSKGAELALLVASREPRIRATALVAPSAYVWFGLDFTSGAPETSSWSAAGAPVPYIPSDAAADADVGRAFGTGGQISFRDTFARSFAAATPAIRERATIPAERVAGPIICIAGDDDNEWDSPGACATIEARRRAAHRDAGDAVVIEPGAGHALPFSGKPVPRSFPAGPATLVLGGTPDANARGGADAFAKIIAFFDRTLR